MDFVEHRDFGHSTASLLRRLKALAVAALAIVLILLTMIGWRDYEARFERLELRNLAQARSLAGHVARNLDSADIVMERLASRLDRVMRVGEPRPSILLEMLSYTVATQSLAESLTLLAPDGTVLADSQQRTADATYLQEIRRILEAGPNGGSRRLSIARLHDPDGAGGLVATRLVQAAYRDTAFYLTAELSKVAFLGFYGSGESEGPWEVALLTADGTIVAATDDFLGLTGDSEGRNLSAILPFDQLGRDGDPIVPPRHWHRIVALAGVEGWPFAVLVATDIEPLIWDWAFIAGALGLAALLITAGTVVAMRLGERYLRRLAETENELRLRVVDLEISRMQLQEQGEQATLLAEELYFARDEAEAARSEAEVARYAADQANQAKSEFLARMSHELRTPLNAILGFAEIMKEGIGTGGSGSASIQYSQDIYDSGSHLLSVINDILDLSKVEAGRFELAEEEVDLDYAARSVAKLVRETAVKRGLKVTVSVPPDSPRIRSDQRVVRQMLLNLLSNSLKFTPKGGSVSVLVRQCDGQVSIAVQDTGIGIDEKNFAKILEPFGQVHDPSTDDSPGTGLGLPLVKSFIEEQGGRMELQSRVGEGTTVTLVFPADRVIAPSADQGGVMSEAC